MFIGYTHTPKHYHLYDPKKKVVFTARDIIFEESKSYYPSETKNEEVLQCYYAPEIQPWEEKDVWGDEFNEEETDVELLRALIVNPRKKTAMKYQEPRESDEEQLIDLGKYDEGENMYREWQPDFKVMGPPALPGSFVQ